MSEIQNSTASESNDQGAERWQELRDAYIAEFGFWPPPFTAIREADPEFFTAFMESYLTAIRRRALEPKVREFIALAVNATAPHGQTAEASRAHIRAALRQGATREEILEVLEMISMAGIHACTLGVPILLDELKQNSPDKE